MHSSMLRHRHFFLNLTQFSKEEEEEEEEEEGGKQKTLCVENNTIFT